MKTDGRQLIRATFLNSFTVETDGNGHGIEEDLGKGDCGDEGER